MKLNSISIQNFRCFKDITIDFHKQLTVIVGSNGSGKTAVLDAIAPTLASIVSKTMLLKISYFERNSFSTKDIHGGDKTILPCFIFKLGEVQDHFNHKVMFTKNSDGRLSLDLGSSYVSYLMSNNKSKDIDNFILFVYYKAKRFIADTPSRPLLDTTLKSAYTNMLSQDIDVPLSLAWFDSKDAEQARERDEDGNRDYIIAELDAVKKAIENVLQEYINPRMKGTPPELVISKKNDPKAIVSLTQLSDGYRTMLALVMDVARRMAIANAEEYNKQGKCVLESPAIILIDEVDLHLHPSWQQRVLPDLMRTFPNAQFIVTTHSPQVISSIPSECIRILDKGKVYGASTVTEGVDSAMILQEVFGVNPLPQNIRYAADLEKYKELVYADKWDEQKTLELRKELEAHYGPDYAPLYELLLHVENCQWERENEESL